jgi:ATP-dependent HslUV protease, peptidase subunit HslV
LCLAPRKAVIAADTLSKFGETKVERKYRIYDKIIHFKDSYIGVTGASAHRKVLQHLLTENSELVRFDSEMNIFISYLNLHPILKENYFMNTSEENDDTYESSQIDALIANPNGIFGMYSWREVFEYEKFWALGSGFDCAMGAMYAVYDVFDEPEQIAEIGVKSACEFDDACGLPMTLHSVILETENSQDSRSRKGKKKS